MEKKPSILKLRALAMNNVFTMQHTMTSGGKLNEITID